MPTTAVSPASPPNWLQILSARVGSPKLATLPAVGVDTDCSAAFDDLHQQLHGADTVLFPAVSTDALGGFFRLRLAQLLRGEPVHPGLSVVLLREGEWSRPGFADRFRTGWPFERCLFVAPGARASTLSDILGLRVISTEDTGAEPLRPAVPAGQKIAAVLQPLWPQHLLSAMFASQAEDLVAAGFLTIRLFYDGNARRGPTFDPEFERLIAENNREAGAHIDVAAMPEGIRPILATPNVAWHWARGFANLAECVVRDPSLAAGLAKADSVLANDLDSFALALARTPRARLCLYPLFDRASRVFDAMIGRGVSENEARNIAAVTASVQAIGLSAADLCVFNTPEDRNRLESVCKRVAPMPAPRDGARTPGSDHAALLGSIAPPDESVILERENCLKQIRFGAAMPQPVSYTFANGVPFSLSGSVHDKLVLLGAWHEAESWGRWTDGETAGLRIALEKPAEGRLVLSAVLVALPAGGTVSISVGDYRSPPAEPIAGVNRWDLPAGIIAGQRHFDVMFRASRAVRPSETGDSPDRRVLGVGIVNAGIEAFRPTICIPGQWLHLNSDAAPREVLLNGWHVAESWGVWSAAEKAVLRLTLQTPLIGPHRLEVELSGRPEPGILELAVDGHALPWSDIGEGERAWPLPVSVTAGKTELTIELAASPLFSPAELGDSADDRWLGVPIRSVGLFPEATKLRTGETYRIGAGPGDRGVLVSGWHELESWGCWSNGHDAVLHLPYPAVPAVDLALELELTPPLRGGMVALTVNGVPLPSRLLSKGWNTWVLPPEGLSGSTGLAVTIHAENPIRPMDIEDSEDDRLLGIGLSGFRIKPAAEVSQD